MDTWGWLALRDKKGHRHKEIKDLYLSMCSRKCLFPFTDLTTMVVMTELQITDILTEDDLFTQVGMGFQKMP